MSWIGRLERVAGRMRANSDTLELLSMTELSAAALSSHRFFHLFVLASAGAQTAFRFIDVNAIPWATA
jgi:hypothetical protein